MLQALSDITSVDDQVPSTPRNLFSAAVVDAPGVCRAVERMTGAAQLRHAEALNPSRRAGARYPFQHATVLLAACTVISPSHDHGQLRLSREEPGEPISVANRPLDVVSIARSDVIAHGEQVPWLGGNRRVRVDEPESAKFPTPSESDHPGHRRVIADRTGRGSIQQHPGQDGFLRVPYPFESIAVATAAGEDRVAAYHFN